LASSIICFTLVGMTFHPSIGIEPPLNRRSNVVMTDENNNLDNRVDRSAYDTYHALWHGRVVYENGRVKRFTTESEAWAFLARCDLAGKILH
ncbi:MAG: hypothetical protein WA704_29390, partial [Pseudolabrys sp.]